MDGDETPTEELLRKVERAVTEFHALRENFDVDAHRKIVNDALKQKQAILDDLDRVQAEYDAKLRQLNMEIEMQETATLEFEKMLRQKFVDDRKRLEAASTSTLSADLRAARQELADIQAELQTKSREVLDRGKVPGASDATADNALLLALYQSFGVSLERGVSVESRWKAIQQLIN